MAEKYPLVLNGTNIEELQSGDSIAGAIDSVSEDTSPNLGGNLNTGSYNVSFGDNAKALFGASNDLQIYHDGSNSYIAESGTGNLFITSSGDQIQLRTSGGSTMVRAYVDGETQLFYNGNNKLQTKSTGISVTGNVTATSFTGDGSNLTGISGGKVLGISSVDTIIGNTSFSGIAGTQIGTSGAYYPSGQELSVTYTKQSSTSMIIAFGNINYKYSGSESGLHSAAFWTGSTVRGIGEDIYRQSIENSNYWGTTAQGQMPFTGLSSGSHTFNFSLTRGNNNNVSGTFNNTDGHSDGLNYCYLYVMEVEV